MSEAAQLLEIRKDRIESPGVGELNHWSNRLQSISKWYAMQ
jgi:hypothetical protein